MKNRFQNVKLFLATLLTVFGSSACHDAGIEVFDTDLSQQLRPFEVTALALDAERISVSWQGSGSLFRLEYAKNETFDEASTTVVETDLKQYTATGLDEASTYYFRVQTLSENPAVAVSEYSAVAYARTLVEPKIPNVTASSTMEYTLSPWSVTCTVTMTWGDSSLEPEAITSVKATPVAGGEALTFAVSEEEAAAQSFSFSEGILTDTEYLFELYVGTRMRGSCTHRTVPGPTPALYTSSQLDFSTSPITATVEVRWELYYITPDQLKEVLFTRSGAETPERQESITPEDIAAGSMTVTELIPGTEYRIDLKGIDDTTIATTTCTTSEAPGDDVLIVRPEEDLSAIISDPERTHERIYLIPGEYSLWDGSATTITRNLELYAENPQTTTLVAPRNFQLEGTMDFIVFRNLRIVCSTYLVQAKSDYDLARYTVDNCIVDLNSGATGGSTLFSTSTGSASSQILHEYEVVNSTIFANAGQTQNIVYGSASSSIGRFEKITMRNSTFSNCARGLITVSNTADIPYEIVLDGCTLYNMGCAGSNALLDIRIAGTQYAAQRSIALRNSIIHYGSTKGYKLLQFGGKEEGDYIPSEQIDCENFHYFSSQTPAFGSSAYNIADRMTSYSGTPTDLWSNPMADPSAAGASFRIKDPAIRAAQEAAGTTLGDQRWEEQ